MSTESHRLVVGGVPVEVCRRDIKHLHIGVYPPRGKVRVAVPLRLTDDAVRLALVSRLAWIRRQQAAFEAQERQSEREMVSGESHYFQGRRYRLRVLESDGPASVRLVGNSVIELRVRPASGAAKRRAVLMQWYRQRLREALPPLLAKWEPGVGVKVAEVRIKKMKTRWGSCNADAHRIWLNLELAKKAPTCLEYILVHEMVHFLERRHSERFRELMDTLMPTWQLARDELNRAPLAHEEWRY